MIALSALNLGNVSTANSGDKWVLQKLPLGPRAKRTG